MDSAAGARPRVPFRDRCHGRVADDEGVRLCERRGTYGGYCHQHAPRDQLELHALRERVAVLERELAEANRTVDELAAERDRLACDVAEARREGMK